MGKYASVVIGAIVVLLGLLGLTSWWGEFTAVIKGLLPAMLIFAGAVAVIAGLSEMKDEAASKKEEPKK